MDPMPLSTIRSHRPAPPEPSHSTKRGELSETMPVAHGSGTPWHFTIAFAGDGHPASGPDPLDIAGAARKLGREVTMVVPSRQEHLLAAGRRLGFRTVGIHGRSRSVQLANMRRWDALHRSGVLWCADLDSSLATSGHPDRIVQLGHDVGRPTPLETISMARAVDVLGPSLLDADLPGRIAGILNRLDPPPPARAPRVVLAHDYLTQRGGAERVVGTLAEAFPDAVIVTSLYDPQSTFPEFQDRSVVASPLNLSRFLRTRFRFGLPLYSWVFSHARVPGRPDVVVASTTGFAHGVRTPPGVKKLVYCHSPARFLYLSDDYLGRAWWRTPKGWVLKALRPALIRCDKRAAASADRYLCNSSIVRERIRRTYGIDATVVNPPYSLDPTADSEPIPQLVGGGAFYLVVSRLMPYKNVDVLLRAFARMPERRLVVVGRGPLGDSLHRQAGDNVTFLEGIPDSQLRWAYDHATAVLAPSKEDYGLTPVEGFSFGTPALALHAGGYLDTVVDGVSGYFFEAATPEAVTGAIERLEAHPLDRGIILDHARRFAPQVFQERIRTEVAALAGGDR